MTCTHHICDCLKERMQFLSKWFSSKRPASGQTVLNVILGETHVATLWFDGSHYCLKYMPAFLDSGLAPFNATDFERNERPDTSKVYKSEQLWHAFASRLPAESRDDFASLLHSLNVTDEDGLLEILAKTGRVSISKPWRLEPSEKKRA